MKNKEKKINKDLVSIPKFAELSNMSVTIVRKKIKEGLIETVENEGQSLYYGKLIDLSKTPLLTPLKRGRESYSDRGLV